MAVGLIATIILRLRNIAKHHQTLAGWNETRSFVLRFEERTNIPGQLWIIPIQFPLRLINT